MNRKLEIFENVLTSPFNNDDFVGFVRELLNNVELVAPTKYNKEYSNFSFYVDGYYHIGNYISDDNDKIAVLSVCLNRGDTVERARGMQRNFVKPLIEKGNCAGALVAFYTKDEPAKWRLSFIRMDYEFSMGKVKEKLTPAKRYSYLVGDKEPCHTAKQRLYPIFMEDNKNPGIDELEEAFSVEKVTNEFFNLYKEKYIQLKEYLDTNEEFVQEATIRNFTSEQFAKKLMGQIVFLYFIQKKGWLGVEAIPVTMTEKQYKNAFFARGTKSREIIPKVYAQQPDGTYRIVFSELQALSDEDEEFLAGIVKGKPWGSGPKDFMRRMFDGCVEAGKNYFDDYLEPLFYTGLNKNRGENGFYAPLHRRIPFLNGGLFEQLDNYEWENNNFAIPNELFSNKAEKGRDADGILDIFDRYNFTMNEDEPMEREVAIDPEMLGKVFENLLDVKDRKSKGAFYTPREIVHYMCQETLINHLVIKTELPEADIRDFILYGDLMKDEDTAKEVREGTQDMLISSNIFDLKSGVNRLKELDDILANVKVADLAVGSGAFPLGMLNEIVKARETLSAYMAIGMNAFQKKTFYAYDRKPYDLKVNTIKNCIFACDIEASAVDIAKLRLWLSIVIDDEIVEDAGNGEFDAHTKPRQLPNLDCNIICGNSLIDEFKGNKLINESELLHNVSENSQIEMFQGGVDSLLNELIKQQDKLFFIKDHDEKEETKQKIQDIYNQIILEQIQGNPELVEAYYDSLKEPSRPFIIWQLYFPKVFRDNGGFDIVIGNPPYIGEEGHKELFQEVASTEFGKKYYVGKMDFWYFFTSKGIELLCKDGCISFIAPNNWMTTAGGKNMRKHIAKSGEIKKFVTFNNVMIFESASQQTMIFVIQKSHIDEKYKLEYKAVGNKNLSADELSLFLATDKVGEHYLSMYNPIEYLDGKSVQFLNSCITEVTEKIKSGNKLYLMNDEIINGIHPHHAAVTKKMLPLLPTSNVGDGIFILKNSEIESMSIPENERKIMHPYYDSDSIGRYYFNSNIKAEIIYTTSDFKDTTLMDGYPTLKAHLDKYVDVITSDNRPYGLHRARKQAFFEHPKICSLRKCTAPSFSYIEEPAYVTAEWYLIMTNRVNMKYLTVLLNSSLIKFWLLKMGKMQGSIYQVDKAPLVNIPILVPSAEICNQLCDIYNQIIDRKKNNKDADTLKLEKIADDILFEAYGMNDHDIDVVMSTIYEWESK